MQLLTVPTGITTSKPPPIRMQQLRSAHYCPSYGGGYGRKVGPHPILVAPVHVEENERHEICDSTQHKSLSLTVVEESLSIFLLHRARFGSMWMFRKIRNYRDLAPEVRFERMLEGGHDFAEVLAREVLRGLEICQVLLEACQAGLKSVLKGGQL